MNRFSLVAATLALSIFCTPNVASAADALPQTPSEWMDFLEKQSINQEDYGNSDQNFVTDSLPLLKDSAQKPDPNVIKIMIDPGHANYYNPSTVVNGYYESVMTWTLSNYLKEELEALGVQADLTKTSLEDDPDLQPRGHMSAGYDFFLSVHSNATSYSSIDYPVAICYQNLDWTDIDDTSRAVGQLLTDKVTEVMETRQKGIIWQRLSDNDRDGNGVNDDEWYGVLCGARYVGTPGVLMEHSFHTNYRATVWLMQDSNLRKLAKEEANVLYTYFRTQKESNRYIGDVDGDGSLSVQDAVQILTYYAQQAAGCSPTFASDLQYTTADYDGDGSITVNDAVSVLETYAKQAAGLQPGTHPAAGDGAGSRGILRIARAAFAGGQGRGVVLRSLSRYGSQDDGRPG